MKSLTKKLLTFLRKLLQEIFLQKEEINLNTRDGIQQMEIQHNRKANGFPNMKMKGDHRLTALHQEQSPASIHEAKKLS